MNTPQSSRKVAIARQAGGSGKDHDAGFQPAPTPRDERNVQPKARTRP